MKNKMITILMVFSSMLISENTTIQVVNGVPNSVYNLKFENQNVINDLQYRTSSRLTEAPETSIVNVLNSENEESFGLPLNFTESGNYFVTIAGISGNNDKPLGLYHTPMLTQEDDNDIIRLNIINSLTDINSIDVEINNEVVILELKFGEYRQLSFTQGQQASVSIISTDDSQNYYSFDISSADRSIDLGTIIISGSINSENDVFHADLISSNGQSTDLLDNQVVLDGTANVQIIHNSPYPTVDIYVDGTETLGDVAYRATTGLLELPTTTTVGIAAANDATILASFDFTLEENANYVVIASGILNDVNHPFDLVASSLETSAQDDNSFALKVYHGVTDAPAVDIYADGTLIASNLSYGSYTEYLQVAAADYTIDVAAHGTTTPVASFAAPLASAGGGAGIVFASGFLAPPATTDSEFALILTTPDGTSTELPASNPVLGSTANVQIIHNSPYPTVDIYVDGTETLGDVAYRATTGLLELPTTTTVGIAAANDATILASFDFTLEENANYVVIASGILNDVNHPFDLVASSLETSAQDDNSFALKVYHGVTDAPAVDIYADGTLIASNLSYGSYTEYLQVAAADYTIDVAAHGTTTPVASFAAPLASAGGGAGIVFASGFLAPPATTDSEFALILTTPDGTSTELPSAPAVLAVERGNITSPTSFTLKQNYPNPFNPSTSIDFELRNNGNVEVKVFDINGKLVNTLYNGYLTSGSHGFTWNGKSYDGNMVSGGIYLYSVTNGNDVSVRKMSLIK